LEYGRHVGQLRRRRRRRRRAHAPSPRAIPLAMITMRKSGHGFPFLSRDEYGVPLGRSWGGCSLIKLRQVFTTVSAVSLCVFKSGI